MVRPPALPQRLATQHGARWLAVGPGAAQALKQLAEAGTQRYRLLQARDVYEALDVAAEQPVGVCVLAAPLLRSRPAALVRALRQQLGERTRVFFHGSTGSPSTDRRLLELGLRPVATQTNKPERRNAATKETGQSDRFALACLRRTRDPQGLDELLLQTFASLSRAGRVTLFRRRQGRMTLVAGRGLPTHLVGTARLRKGEGLGQRALHLREPLLGRAQSGGARGYQGAAYALLPLSVGGRPEGLLCLTELPSDTLPTSGQLRRWVRHLEPAAEALAISRRWAKARRRSGHDGLTGLPNRAAFERALAREVERAVRGGSGLAVGLLDVDRFKTVNDTHGHPAGDRVLREVGRRLAEAFRGTDLVARYGGEEFAVLLPSARPPTAEQAWEALERARVLVRAEMISLGERAGGLRVTISGGVARLGEEVRDPAALIQRADQALYAAKQAGRDRILPTA